MEQKTTHKANSASFRSLFLLSFSLSRRKIRARGSPRANCLDWFNKYKGPLKKLGTLNPNIANLFRKDALYRTLGKL